jgi:hypothetical protein
MYLNRFPVESYRRKFMTQENISTEIWSQAHSEINLAAGGGPISLHSKYHEVAINAGKFVGLTTKQANVYVASSKDTPGSGSISLNATGDEANVNLSAVPNGDAAFGSGLNLNQEGAVLSTGKGEAACKLLLASKGASIVSRSSSKDFGSVMITPEVINISIGTASIRMTPAGITLSFGEIKFELNENGIKETHGETTRVLSSSSGNILTSDKMNQLETGASSFEVGPSDISTTTTNETTTIDSNYQVNAANINLKASSQYSAGGAQVNND